MRVVTSPSCCGERVVLLIKFLGEILHQYTHKGLCNNYGHFNCEVHRPKLIVILKHIELAKNWWYPEGQRYRIP